MPIVRALQRRPTRQVEWSGCDSQDPADHHCALRPGGIDQGASPLAGYQRSCELGACHEPHDDNTHAESFMDMQGSTDMAMLVTRNAMKVNASTGVTVTANKAVAVRDGWDAVGVDMMPL